LAKSDASLTHVWGYDPTISNTEHHSGYALDFMVFSNKALGDRIYAYLIANQKRLGIVHVLWQQSITSFVIQPGVRRPMADRGNGTNNHRDHLHVLFKPTAYQAPVVVKPSSPKPVGDPQQPKLVVDGDRGPATYRALQAYLNREHRAGLAVDGDFGPKTIKAVERWVGGKIDGSMSKDDVRRFQRKVGATADGAWGENTTRALQKFLNAHPGRAK
jgi:hypothetical protein